MNQSPLNPNKLLILPTIALAMEHHHYDHTFIQNAVHVATHFDGVYDLLSLWLEAYRNNDHDEINATFNDIVDMVNLCLPTLPQKSPSHF